MGFRGGGSPGAGPAGIARDAVPRSVERHCLPEALVCRRDGLHFFLSSFYVMDPLRPYGPLGAGTSVPMPRYHISRLKADL